MQKKKKKKKKLRLDKRKKKKKKKSCLQNLFTNYTYLIQMYKKDLALNNLPQLICHETQPN